jgi:hypothetical protein
MQYLLTEQEYKELYAKIARAEEEVQARLQKVCTLAAKHVPVKHPWDKNVPATPWGCIIGGGGKQGPGYCDECPVSKECPCPHKEWSQ